MKKFTKIFAAVLITATLFSCNNTEKKDESATVKTDTLPSVQALKPEATKSDTVEIYRFKGSEAYINNEYIKTCTEQEKALLAYYCYFFNTSCADSKHCKLTEALGLGEQNSSAHKQLVLKWFNDTETIDLAKEGGRITPAGAKNMAWYEELKFVKKGSNLIIVRYLSNWSAADKNGKGKGTDEYELEPKHIKVIGRLHEELDGV